MRAVTRRSVGALLVAVALAVFSAATPEAQLQRPKATVSALVEMSGIAAGTTARVALKVSLPEGLHTQSNTPRDPNLIPTVLGIDAPAGVTVAEVVFPPSTDLKQAGQDQPLAVFEREFLIGVRLTLAADVKPGDLTVPAHLRYQACDATVCYAPSTTDVAWTLPIVADAATARPASPDTFAAITFGRGESGASTVVAPPPPGPAAGRTTSASVDALLTALDGFSVLGTTGGYLASGDFLAFIHNAERGVTDPKPFEGRGPLAILLLVFIGGLALNLTPCVLPMVPINLAIIGAGARRGSRSRGFLLGGAYGAAMALVYGVLGVIVILTAGTFGTINASPWFNAVIAVLFVVLALAMFDLMTIDFSRFSGLHVAGTGQGSMVLAFSMGAVAALLAGACVAPVVIEVVLFSSDLYAKGTTSALALPFLLGIGMAVPWPIAGAGLAALPKPGAWMVRVKQLFGVLILATALYYGYEAYGLFANRWVDEGAVRSAVAEQLKAGWHDSLADGLAAAKREGKPVLIDMWATWCKNCLTMDKTTLSSASVVSALDGYVKIKFQAENPDEQPARAMMRRFDAVGLPAYVILRPKS